MVLMDSGHPLAIPPGINAIEMHHITWPQMYGFIRRAVTDVLDPEKSPSGVSQA
jgi:hypothetical protein